MAERLAIPDFQLANRLYAGATVTFYTVSGGAKTSTKATLYDAATGTGTVANPVTLDGEGKFSTIPYVGEAVIGTVSGLSIADHDTGIAEALAVQSRNLLINGDFRVAQRGTAFTSASTPANNDDTYLLDRWILLSDGNDIVDVNQLTDGGLGDFAYLEADVETTAKKFGFLQIIEQKDLQGLLSGSGVVSLSFKAKVSDATKLDNIKAAILSWSGTADSPTSDIVSAWNAADNDPTFATNWTAENTPADLEVTATEATYKIENITIDTASVANIAVFIWSDAVADNDTAGTKLHITDVQLEEGPVASAFARRPIAEESALCERYYCEMAKSGSAWAVATTDIVASVLFPTSMRTAPTAALLDTSPTFNDYNSAITGSSSTLVSALSATPNGVQVRMDGFTGATVSKPGFWAQTASIWSFDAEL